MTLNTAKMWVLATGRCAIVKIAGKANFVTSIDFRTLLNELRAKNHTYFVLDLSECILMDSTFLGVLAGFGLKSPPEKADCGGGLVELLNPNERVVELLDNLGVLHLFRVRHGALPIAAPGDAQPLVPSAPSKEVVALTCLEAHKTLIDINPENAPKFKEVTEFLANDLKKIQAGA